MSVFVTGATGYLGSYVVPRLALDHGESLLLLVRAANRAQAIEKLWKGLQLHLDPAGFRRVLARVDFVYGDLTAPGLGLSPEDRRKVERTADSVLHIAASLNRKSEKACLNANLRGTLSVIQLAREIAAGPRGLRRFSHVSTVAVCGRRDREIVTEDAAIDWNRSDYDPYGRTKKFCEHMVRELLPGVPKTFFRPSIVMGDARHPRTTQFDMVRAFCVLADLPVLPMRGETRLDIVNADFVGRAIADLHVKERLRYDCYHLSAGTGAGTAREIGEALVSRFPGRRPPRFVPAAERPFAALVGAMASLPRSQVARIGSLLKVFLPYITFDTVFDNTRIVEELGEAPAPFIAYCSDLYAWAKSVRFEYPYVPLPADALAGEEEEGARAWASAPRS
jgi:nucleoside-diphosphate-sugar epimerase